MKLSYRGAVFPASVAAVMLGFAGCLFWAHALGPGDDSAFYDQESNGDDVIGAGIASVRTSVVWFASLLALAALIGFILAFGLFSACAHSPRSLEDCALHRVFAQPDDFPRRRPDRRLSPGPPANLVELPWPLR